MGVQSHDGAQGWQRRGRIAQIKVAPNVKDLKALQAALAASPLAGRWRDVDAAIDDNINALSAPRLHRSP